MAFEGLSLSTLSKSPVPFWMGGRWGCAPLADDKAEPPEERYSGEFFFVHFAY